MLSDPFHSFGGGIPFPGMGSGDMKHGKSRVPAPFGENKVSVPLLRLMSLYCACTAPRCDRGISASRVKAWNKVSVPLLRQPYNLEDDPGEKNNHADEHPEMVKELRSLSNRYRASGRSVQALNHENK